MPPVTGWMFFHAIMSLLGIKCKRNDNTKKKTKSGNNNSKKTVTKPGFYTDYINVTKTFWVIPKRYTQLQLIGFGAFGQVCSAVDEVTGQKVAIKKQRRPFHSEIVAQRCYREIRVMKQLAHENLIEYFDSFTPDDCVENLEDVYVVTCLMPCDLKDIIGNQRNRLSDKSIQFMVYQILRGLKYLHSAQLIHRDLKPSNIAVNDVNELRILDFGLVRKSEQNRKVTPYVQTRWYRAPEVLLKPQKYTEQVDVWSVGCIMAELFSGKPIIKGTDYLEQLKKIFELRGTPSPEALARMANQDAIWFISTLGTIQKKDLKDFVPAASEKALDLLDKMLTLDPEERISVDEALRHPYLSSYHDPEDEPTCDPYEPAHDDDDKSIEEWKKVVWDEVHLPYTKTKPNDQTA